MDSIDSRILDSSLSLQLDMEQEIRLNQTVSDYKILIMYNYDAHTKQLQ